MSVLQKDAVNIRWMIRRDLDDVATISGGRVDRYLDLLRQRDVIGCVAEVDGVIVGFVIYRFLSREHTLLLLQLRVADGKQKQGIGKNLVAKLKRKLEGERYRALIADIDEVDLQTQLFLKAVGFQAVAIVDMRQENSLSPKGTVCYRFQYPVFGKKKGLRDGEERHSQEADAST